MTQLPISAPDSKNSELFLQQYPSVSQSLLAECDYSLDRVKTLIEPALKAPNRCQTSSSYIQAVSAGRTHFLVTNLSLAKQAQVTDISTRWLIGRSITCAIPLPHLTVSRCHAVITCLASNEFYINDLHSSNGTWVNQTRLTPMQNHRLNDGDLLRLGCQQVEFFLVDQLTEDEIEEPEEWEITADITCCDAESI